MNINANLIDGYILNPATNELSAFSRIFHSLLEPCAGGGWGYKSLDKVALYTVESGIYFGNVANVTRSYATKTAALTALGLVIENSTGNIINAKKGVVMPQSARISFDKNNYSANHVPQLLAVTSFGVITSINGEYCFKSGFFKGLINFSSLISIFKNAIS